ncbi:SP15-like protein, partial [Mya arenaria]
GNGKGGGGGGGTTVTPSNTYMTSNPTSKPTSSKTANLGNLSVTWGSGVSFNIADKGQWSHNDANKSTPLLSPTNCSSTNAVICLEWADDRRLKVSRKNDVTNEQNASLSCYDVEWTALKCVGQVLTDCFNTSGAHWYGGYEDHDQHWPFEKNSMKETSYTGNDPFHPGVIGNILERYFVSSKGVGVYVDNDVPLYFSLNSPQNGLMCFSANDMIQNIHDLGFNVSVWVHPFFDPRGESYKEAEQKHYLLRRFDSDFPEVTSWWNGNDSGILDVTNPNATKYNIVVSR